jgi:hypothetical protein
VFVQGTSLQVESRTGPFQCSCSPSNQDQLLGRTLTTVCDVRAGFLLVPFSPFSATGIHSIAALPKMCSITAYRHHSWKQGSLALCLWIHLLAAPAP